MVWGKVLTCVILVPVQAGAWILLLSANRIAIANPGLILLHVTLASSLLILLGAICALHYRERTAAQFVFSTALVVILLFVLALPYNPLNLVARLSVGAARRRAMGRSWCYRSCRARARVRDAEVHRRIWREQSGK